MGNKKTARDLCDHGLFNCLLAVVLIILGKGKDKI